MPLQVQENQSRQKLRVYRTCQLVAYAEHASLLGYNVVTTEETQKL
jgi:hypothetical protein